MSYSYVFNIGFNKAGTTSLTKALNLLGIKTVHFKTKDGKDLEKDYIEPNHQNNRKLFYPIDQEFRGFSDFNGDCWFKNLYEQYPNSKFIFTVRYFPDWVESNINEQEKLFPEKFKSVKSTKDQYSYYIKKYYERKNNILDFFKDKQSDFLIMDICNGDGWDKLCTFLNLKKPDFPFPVLNTSNQLNEINNQPRLNKSLNLDITNRCPLECPGCARQNDFRNMNESVPGYDLSIEEFEKITDYFKNISFCGQYSDPIHHPNFIDFLEICNRKDIKTEIHTASSYKSKEWFIKAFETYPQASWIFGIDGLPEESHKYRINQDGIKLYNIMLESKKYLENPPIWQYIIFSYNEKNIDLAMEMAAKNEIYFMILNSARWFDATEKYKPSIRK